MNQILFGGTVRSHYRVGMVMVATMLMSSIACCVCAVIVYVLHQSIGDVLLLAGMGIFDFFVWRSCYLGVRACGREHGVVL